MGFRILVVEDNPDNLELMTYLLKAFGHTPLTAQDGVEALEVARAERPDLVICDIQLPRMNGYQVAQSLKDDPTLAHVPRVAVTALAMVGDREKVMAAGFDGYIPKPIMPEIFVAQIEKFLPGKLHSSPVAAAPSGATTAQPAPMAAKGVRILVVDNTPVNLQLARSLLEPLGYQLLTASDAWQAMAIARQHHPDLIISDVHMPFGSGFELIEAVKADPALKAIPFVFLSASLMSDSVREKCLGLGANRYILRPVDPQALVSEIESLLQEPAKGDE
jgi:two-component system cell cycle response regulator